MNTFATAVLLAATVPVHVTDLDPQAVEARALQSRRDIRSAHIVAAVRIDQSITSPANRRQIAERLEIWQSPAGHRLERAALSGGPLDSTGISRKLICRGCGPDGTYVTFHPPKISFNVYAKDHPDGKAWDFQLIDPRVVGYSYAGVYGTTKLDQIVGTAGLKHLSAERVVFKGDDAILVRGVFPAHNNARHACWVVPGKGYSVVRVEAGTPDDPAGPDAPPCFVESELALDAPSGVWFPRRSVRRTYYGGQLLHDELVEVTTAEFNRVPDTVFRMAALGLPVGELVHDGRTHREMYWTGKGLSHKRPGPPGGSAVVVPAAEPTPAEAVPTGAPDRWLTTAATVGLALAGAMLIRRAFARRG